jgi:Ni/Co efflux regulator RcnB/surface antigen
MKVIFTAALAASLLAGTATMAQPGDDNRGHSGEQADRKAQKAEGKAEDKRADRAPDQAVAAPRGLSAPQMATPDRAAESLPQGRGARNAPSAQINQQVTVAPVPAAPVQAVPDASLYTRGQMDHMQAQRPAPIPRYQAPQNQAPQYQPPQYPTRNTAAIGGDMRSPGTRWSRGDRLPDQYRQDRYYVNDWQQYGLRQPPGGYRWIRDDNNDFYLSLIATGIISDTVYRSDRDDRWRQRYSRDYSYNDDVYYQQCRRSPDPAGILVGGLIGGLLGNSAGRGGNRAGATLAGVIVGGAVGAALTRNMDCDDRSYAYRSYYNGFNSGRPGNYQWRNPRNEHRGEFRIGGYYNDPYGFRCARFAQVTYIQGRAYRANGVACRQPNGSWAVVS